MNKNRKLINAFLVSTMMLSGLALDVSAADGDSVHRIGGKDRVETSINVGDVAYDKSDAVVVAGWNGQADALTGTLLASAKDAPLLLVSNKDDDIASVRAKIDSLGAKTVYLLGDTNVISQKAENALGAGLTVKRVKGDDRFDTAVAVATEVGSTTGHAFITVDGRSGELADALAAGPASGLNNSPILLTSKNSLPAQTKQALKDLNISSVTIVGGTSAVSTAVETAIKAEVSTVNRVEGADRAATAEAVANEYFANADKAIITNDGRVSYADALVGGYFGAKNNAPILLTQAGKLNDAPANFLGGNAMSAFVLGSETVVSSAVFTEVKEIIDAKEVSIADVTAVNAKTVEVTFDKAVEDTSKVTVELLRGTFKQNATVKWAEDKMSVQLIGANNFQAGDYTVNVKGLAEEVLTGSVKIEAQKVSSIEILDDVAVVNKALKAGRFPAGTTATVGFMVKDQYGEDMTKTANLKTNNDADISVNSATGVVTIGSNLIFDKTVGNVVPVVLVDTATGVSTTKTLSLSAESTVSEISVSGIYNAKGEAVELDDKSKANEAFIVVDLKDQYGKEITAAAKASGLVVTNTNENNLAIGTKVEEQKIGDKTKLVVKISQIKKAGSTDILLISTTNGKSAKYTVNVAETTTSDAITAGKPEVAVANEDVLVPVTVTDKQGNVITDLELLSTEGKGIKVNNTLVDKKDLVLKDGQVYYKFAKAVNTTEGTQALVFTTPTYKVATVTFEVRATAKPVAIRGLKNPLVIKKETPVTINSKTHLVIEDQYGREMKDENVGITVAKSGETDVVSVEGTKVKGLKNGTATLKVQLASDGKGDSAVEIEVQVTDGKEYKSYEAKDLGLLHAEKAGGNDLVVSGVLENGGKVKLVGADYKATTNLTGVTVDADGKLQVAEDAPIWTVNKETVTERDVKVTFTMNNDGKQVVQTYTISKKAPQTQSIFFTEALAGSDVNKAKEFTKVLDISGEFNKANLVSAINVFTTDQYGNKEVVTLDTADDIVRVVPADASKVNVVNNATNDVEVTLVNAKEAELTVTVKVGNATKDITVNLVEAK